MENHYESLLFHSRPWEEGYEDWGKNNKKVPRVQKSRESYNI